MIDIRHVPRVYDPNRNDEPVCPMMVSMIPAMMMTTSTHLDDDRVLDHVGIRE